MVIDRIRPVMSMCIYRLCVSLEPVQSSMISLETTGVSGWGPFLSTKNARNAVFLFISRHRKDRVAYEHDIVMLRVCLVYRYLLQ